MQSDKFPASAAFDAINSALTASEADRKDAIKKGGAVFGFTLKNSSGDTESWHIDLKEKGEVQKGLPEKPTGMYTLPRAILPPLPPSPRIRTHRASAVLPPRSLATRAIGHLS